MSKIYKNDIFSIEEILSNSDQTTLTSIRSVVKLISDNTYKYIPLYNQEQNETVKIQHFKIINSLASISQV